MIWAFKVNGLLGKERSLWTITSESDLIEECLTWHGENDSRSILLVIYHIASLTIARCSSTLLVDVMG